MCGRNVITIGITISFTWYVLLPWMANHYSFALPGEKGLPYRGLQALLELNLRLATTDYLSNGYDGF